MLFEKDSQNEKQRNVLEHCSHPRVSVRFLGYLEISTYNKKLISSNNTAIKKERKKCIVVIVFFMNDL